MFKHFQLLPFLAGLVVGCLYFFTKKPDASDRVVKWPHPDNTGKAIYRDRNGLCYSYEAQLTDCAKVSESLVPFNHE